MTRKLVPKTPSGLIQSALRAVATQLRLLTEKGRDSILAKEQGDMLCNYLKVLKDIEKNNVEVKKAMLADVKSMSDDELRAQAQQLLTKS